MSKERTGEKEMIYKGKQISDEMLLRVMDKVHGPPIPLDKECIVLKDGTRINCDTAMLASDRCPHGVFLCGNICPEGCKYMLKGKK